MSDVMSDEKWEQLNPPLEEVNEGVSAEDKYTHQIPYTPQHREKIKEVEREYLNKLVDDHWKYIEGVLWAASGGDGMKDESRIAEIGYHYKTAAKHFWSHSREFHIGETL